MRRLMDFAASPWGDAKPWHAALDAAKIVDYGGTTVSGSGPDAYYVYRAVVDVRQGSIPAQLRSRKGDVLLLTFAPRSPWDQACRLARNERRRARPARLLRRT